MLLFHLRGYGYHLVVLQVANYLVFARNGRAISLLKRRFVKIRFDVDCWVLKQILQTAFAVHLGGQLGSTSVCHSLILPLSV